VLPNSFTGCSPSLYKIKDNSVLTLSDDFLNADAAQAYCQMLGGSLVVNKDPIVNSSFENALSKYTSGT